ncbi:hypothetical protein IAR50_007029 [Cryptococcus sp. DSM 104548]
MVFLKSSPPLLPSSPDLRWHKSDRRPFIIKCTILFLSLLYLGFLACTFDLSSVPLPSSITDLTDSWNKENSWSPESWTESGGYQSEAYVTFLSSVVDPWYLLSTRLLLYQSRHSPSTGDPARSFIVLTTPSIPTSVIEQLEKEGAQVQAVELLDGFPVPEGMEANHHWKDQYTKLHIFNLTSCSRVLYMDNDMLLLKSLAPLWENVPESFDGVGGVGERSKAKMAEDDTRRRPEEGEVRDYLNAGFLLVKPDEKTFEELRGVKDYNPFYMEQALLNEYFSWEGAHPWTPLQDKYVSHFPRREQLRDGHYALHAKMWKDDIDRKVVDLWETKVKQMEDYFDEFHRLFG